VSDAAIDADLAGIAAEATMAIISDSVTDLSMCKAIIPLFERLPPDTVTRRCIIMTAHTVLSVKTGRRSSRIQPDNALLLK
jgi:hypothetical protein